MNYESSKGILLRCNFHPCAGTRSYYKIEAILQGISFGALVELCDSKTVQTKDIRYSLSIKLFYIL